MAQRRDDLFVPRRTARVGGGRAVKRLRYRIGYLSETYRAERLRRTVRRSGSLRGERYEPRLDDRHADGDHFRPGNTSSRRGGRERFMRRHGGDVLDEALTAVQLLNLGVQFFGDGRRLWSLLNVDSEGQVRLRNSSSFCWRLFLMRVITWSRLLVRLLLVRRRVKTSFMHRHFFNGSCLKLPGSVNLLYLISHTPTYSRPFPDENGSTMSVECTVVDDEIENVPSFLEVEFSALEFGST